jgi:Lrp/AsnC family transcriptional regulator, regulator for asnA, asnC and gidA
VFSLCLVAEICARVVIRHSTTALVQNSAPFRAARWHGTRQNVLVDPRLADSIDRRIIDQLRIDGRRSFGEIGRYVGLSEASVRSRYNRLRKLGIVQVVGMSDAPKLGEVEAHISIQVRGVTVESVARQLAAHPEVKFVGAALGAFDLMLDVRCADNEHLSKFLHETVRRIRGIERLETATVLEVLVDTYLWAGFREALDRPAKSNR